ncbi:MAG: hypothetical protein WC052_05995 [Patescibacteria group bacterium]
MILLLDKEMEDYLKAAYDAGVTAGLYDDAYDIGTRDKCIMPILEQIKSKSVIIDVHVSAQHKKKS